MNSDHPQSDGQPAPQENTPSNPRPCPICSKLVKRNEPFFPFCSARCRMADLSRWINGSYKISRPIDADDEDDIAHLKMDMPVDDDME